MPVGQSKRMTEKFHVVLLENVSEDTRPVSLIVHRLASPELPETQMPLAGSMTYLGRPCFNRKCKHSSEDISGIVATCLPMGDVGDNR